MSELSGKVALITGSSRGIDLTITFEVDLSAEQRRRLMEIAGRCPVHRKLQSEIDFRTVEELVGFPQ